MVYLIILGFTDRTGSHKRRHVSYCGGDDEEGMASKLANIDVRIEHNEPKGTNTDRASATGSAQSR